MPPSVDFTAWVTPNLHVPLGGVDYSIPPPTVAKAKIILALAVVSEHRLGLVEGEPDPEVLALAEAQTDRLPTITLGAAVVEAMAAAGVDQTTIDRVGYYSLHYWARGKAQADWLAMALWSPENSESADADPKAKPRPRSKSGRSSGSGSQTRTASTRTTASPKT